MHVKKPVVDLKSKCTEVCGNNVDGLDNSMILPVWIHSKQTPSKEILCYCIMDERSNACFMSEELRNQLDAPSSNVSLTLSTIYKSKAVISSDKVEGLEIFNFGRDECVGLPPVYTRESILASNSQIPDRKLQEDGHI